MKKRLASLILAGALALSCSAPAFAAGTTFSDVPSNAWYAPYIQKAVDRGYLTGMGNGQFRPQDLVSNAQFCVMLSAPFFRGEVSGKGAFWWTPYCAAANRLGLLDGTTFGSVGAGNWTEASAGASINRYDMVQMVYNLLDWKGDLDTLERRGVDLRDPVVLTQVGVHFHDSGLFPARYKNAIRACTALGLLAGDSSGNFGGKNPMTRAQAAVVLTALADFNAETAPLPQANDIVSPTPKPDPKPDPKPESGHKLANGQAITEANVHAAILAMKSQYPEGMHWTNDNTYLSMNFMINGHGCAAYALLISDGVFGDLPVQPAHHNVDKIRVGDILRINNDTHSVVVLEVRPNSVIVTEGNYNHSIHWGREIPKSKLRSDPQFEVLSRYPG